MCRGLPACPPRTPSQTSLPGRQAVKPGSRIVAGRLSRRWLAKSAATPESKGGRSILEGIHDLRTSAMGSAIGGLGALAADRLPVKTPPVLAGLAARAQWPPALTAPRPREHPAAIEERVPAVAACKPSTIACLVRTCPSPTAITALTSGCIMTKC